MDLNLQPLAATCYVSGLPFDTGARVTSYLVRDEATAGVVRYDILESAAKDFTSPESLICRWTQVFKKNPISDNTDRALKLTAENLFLTLADPSNDPTPENTRLLLFLSLMLERKRILRARGHSADGVKTIYEHRRTKQLFELPAEELTPEFFVQVQAQLSVLVGEPSPAKPPAPSTGASAPPQSASVQ